MPPSSSLVSVIIPVFNRQRYLERCLDSIAQQVFRPIEVIVVDDGSAPTITLPPSAPHVDFPVRLVRKTQGGPGSARNLGLSMASGTYIYFLDSDDVVLPRGLAHLTKIIAEAGIDLAFGGWRQIDGDRIRLTYPISPYRDSYANAVVGQWAMGSVLLSRRSCSLFNERRYTWEGMEFFLDALAPGRGAAHCCECVFDNIHHDDPVRLTHRFDHFEPLATGLFFAEQKDKLLNKNWLNLDRSSALDFKIASCMHALARERRYTDAGSLVDRVSWPLIKNYSWYTPGSFLDWVRIGGMNSGARLFLAINAMLGR